jgi:gluconate kinase
MDSHIVCRSLKSYGDSGKEMSGSFHFIYLKSANRVVSKFSKFESIDD